MASLSYHQVREPGNIFTKTARKNMKDLFLKVILRVCLLFIYLFLAALVFVAVQGLALVVGSRGYSLAAVPRLLIAVASLVARGLRSCGAQA